MIKYLFIGCEHEKKTMIIKSPTHCKTAIRVLVSIFLISSKTFVVSMPAIPAMFLRAFVSIFFKVAVGLPLVLLESLVII